METSPHLAGPFALGTFSAGSGPAFPGLVAGDRVLDLSEHAPTTRALLERWDDVLPLLRDAATAAAGSGARWESCACTPRSSRARSCSPAPTTAPTSSTWPWRTSRPAAGPPSRCAPRSRR
ncbi:hypothetical protein ACFQ0B_38545 [Nonomuraea thailandensis]